MLIDATHPQESRVAVVDGTQLADYDAETSGKKQFKGNIYLAKVIRIEPSLQAAFVEYGHNRHGFLPFTEIHPDYYRIPVGDRPAGTEQIEGEEVSLSSLPSILETHQEEDTHLESGELHHADETHGMEALVETSLPLAEVSNEIHDHEPLHEDEAGHHHDEEAHDGGVPHAESAKAIARAYRYKIQEVIKRRQIMLVQIVKEERGNKGAALTTYLSLPGRYCVLMPNAGHRHGGISRKIADSTDRKRLRSILDELPIPDGINLIVRTAGQDRNKIEIRRDFEYLIRLWAEIREKTLTSIAPSLVYAEGDLIKRSIRDNYAKEVEEIIVEGEDGYKAAKAFMKTLIPSHAKRVKLFKDPLPLFQKYEVESQIDAIMSPTAQLPSGGSIVINPTEALVAIDVNSGKSTRERHIDETAIKTNLEAADEVARQMRLRDLAGLIVIDFIDMAEQKHVQAVEKRLRDAVRQDRARVQIGRISQFGLLELSRQRLRPSIIESNMKACTHCHGTGMVRSIESTSLFILRAIETMGLSGRSAEIVVTVPAGIDLYLLNQKRSNIVLLENRYQMSIQIQRDDSLVPPDYRIDILVDRASLQKSPTESLPRPSVKVEKLEKGRMNEVSSEPVETLETTEPVQREHQEGRRGRNTHHRKNPYQNWRRNRQDSRQDRQEGGQKEGGRQRSSHEGEGASHGSEGQVHPEIPSDSNPQRHAGTDERTSTSQTDSSSANKDNQRRRNSRRRSRRRSSSESNGTESQTSEKREPDVKKAPVQEGNVPSQARKSNEQQPATVSSIKPSVAPREKKEEAKMDMPTTPKKKRGFWSRLLDS